MLKGKSMAQVKARDMTRARDSSGDGTGPSEEKSSNDWKNLDRTGIVGGRG